jgi:uncharacterized tellurite resistance protein B-like protein
MASESTSSNQPPQDDPEHLSRLRSLIERVMADGRISSQEAAELRAALIADGQITPDEIAIIQTVMREQLGDRHLEFE